MAPRIPRRSRFAAQLRMYRRRWFEAERHPGPLTPNFDGRRFRNELPTIDWAREVGRWLRSRRKEAWPRWIYTEPKAPPPARVEDGCLLTFINHSTMLIQIAGMNFLTDPVYSRRVGPLPWLGARRVRNPGIRFHDLPRIDTILISHDHYDHLDVPTVRRLVARDGSRIVCGLGVERILAIEGLQGAHALDWWQSLDLAADITVTFTPARHFSGRGLLDQDATLWGSFFLKARDQSVYFAGDTGYGPHFAETCARLGPVDCALLPVGCYEPRWFMQTVHMSPKDAVAAHVDLGASRSLGVHFGTFRLGDESYARPAVDLAAAVAAAGLPQSAFILPEFGVGYALEKHRAQERNAG